MSSGEGAARTERKGGSATTHKRELRGVLLEGVPYSSLQKQVSSSLGWTFSKSFLEAFIDQGSAESTMSDRMYVQLIHQMLSTVAMPMRPAFPSANKPASSAGPQPPEV